MIDYRIAGLDDVARLAQMNHRLIRDEGHRNPMTLAELEDRMAGWLQGDYEAVIFAKGSNAVGYALYRQTPEYVYLRHFFVQPDYRRQGIGRAALTWLRQNPWGAARRVRVDVLARNAAGIAFWRAIGFADYALTLEMDL